MAYTYRNKALKGINQNITASSGASQSQQQANRYNSQIANTPSYNGGAYANRISQIADDILNNRKDYSFGGQEAMSKFAMDYSALSGLGVAGAKADTDRLSGGYANSGSQAVADQYRNDYVTPLEQMETTQNIAQAGKQNQLDVGGMLNNANDLALAQYQDRMNALINGRDLAQSAYQALYGTDIDMANARQNALNELMGIESDLNYGKDNLKQSKREADQDYDLAKLALLASASSSSSGGRSGSSRSRKSSGSSGGLSDSWLTDDTDTSSENTKNKKTQSRGHADGVMLISAWIKKNKNYDNATLQDMLEDLQYNNYLTKAEVEKYFNKYKKNEKQKSPKKTATLNKKNTNQFQAVRGGINKLMK